MATQKLKKNLPKRCTNERLKARRAASWVRGQERKALRRVAQERQEGVNRSRGLVGSKVRVLHNEMITKDDLVMVNKSTDYAQIRRNMNVFLGSPTITISYLDEVHERWTTIGKKLKGGAL